MHVIEYKSKQIVKSCSWEVGSLAAGYHLNSEPKLASGGNFSGAGYNIMWMPDPDVGIVAECTKVRDILLPCLLLPILILLTFLL